MTSTGQETIGLYIDGRFEDASTGRVIRVENPKDGSTLAHVAEGDAADIERASMRRSARRRPGPRRPPPSAATSCIVPPNC